MVYVITDGSGYVKIGFATDIYARIMALQTGNPNKLLLLMTLETDSLKNDRLLEKILHNEFRDKRLEFDDGTSTEWFDADVFKTIKRDARSFLKSICKKYDLAFKIHFHFESQAHEIQPWRKAKLKSTLTSLDMYQCEKESEDGSVSAETVEQKLDYPLFGMGENVGTIPELVVGNKYGCCLFTSHMKTDKAKIADVYKTTLGFYYKLDNGIFYSEEMLQAV